MPLSDVPEALPEPLVPAEVDLRAFPYMALDVLRLRDSDLTALSKGDEFKAAVLLWCAAWHQVPAGSLPADDRLLAHYSGAGTRWSRVKAMALRGFVACSDGRLYHGVLAEKVIEAWGRKQAQVDRTRRATEERERRRREGAPLRDVTRDGSRDELRNVQRDVDRDVVQRIGEERKGSERLGEEKKTPTAVSPSAQTKAGGKNDPKYPEIPRYVHDAWIDREHRAGRLKVRQGETYEQIKSRLIAERGTAKGTA
jgi:hypothetical protein